MIDDVGRILAAWPTERESSTLVDVDPAVPAAFVGATPRAPPGPAQLRLATPSSSRPPARWSSASRSLDQNAEGWPSLRGRRYRHRYCGGGPGSAVPRLFPGRLLDHAEIRRHRARPGDQPAAGRAHGRETRRRRAHRRGIDLLVRVAPPRADDAPSLAECRGPPDPLGSTGVRRGRQCDEPQHPSRALSSWGEERSKRWTGSRLSISLCHGGREGRSLRFRLSSISTCPTWMVSN